MTVGIMMVVQKKEDDGAARGKALGAMCGVTR